MSPFLHGKEGNPVSIHREGVEAAGAVEKAREEVAKTISANKDEIIFTSGGTEGNSLALFGSWLALTKNSAPSSLHFITTKIEHPSVLDWFAYFESKGAPVTYLPVDKDGLVSTSELSLALRSETALVSIMSVNNEIGVIQPVAELGKIILNHRKKTNRPCLFHTDASQAMLFCEMRVEKLHVDLMAMDGQKIYGPKGVGALFIKRGVKIEPIMRGGRQEKGLRPGTQNVPGIVGMEEAIRLAAFQREDETARLRKLRDYFVGELKSKIPSVEINGSMEKRLPNNLNISIPGFDNTYLALSLDAAGIGVATRSACIQEGKASYVVSALGKEEKSASSSIRFSMGLATKKGHLDSVIKVLSKIVAAKIVAGHR